MTATAAATDALTSQGYKIEIAADVAGAPDTYAEIGSSTALTLPDETKEFHDYITNSSPEGTQESTPKLRKVIGDTSFELLVNPSLPVQTTLHGFFDNDTKFWLKITNRQTTLTLTMVGYLSKRVFAMNPEDPQKLTVTFHASGPLRAGSTYRPS